jgi:DNA excision repair protein ERCC-3
MKLTITGAIAKLDGTDKDFKRLKSVLSYHVKGYRFSPAFLMHHWDGKRTLLRRDGTFPAGLVGFVRDAYWADDAKIVVVDQRHTPRKRAFDARVHDVKLRPYQNEAVLVAIAKEQGVFQMATGTGKTEVMIGITAALGLRTLILVASKDLAIQTHKRFEDRLRGVKVTMFGAGKHRWGDVTVATLQSIRAWMKRADPEEVADTLGRYDVMHSDECHTLPAATYLPIALAIPAFYRFGWSATPYGDGDEGARLALTGATGQVIGQMRPDEAVAAAVSVPAFVTMLQYGLGEPRTAWKADQFRINDDNFAHYAHLYREAVVLNRERNELITGAAIALAAANRPTLVLVHSIEHGQMIADALDVPFAHGSTEQDVRNAALQSLRDGSVPILVASVIFDQGIDVPELAGLVLAGGGKAAHVAVQRIGRGSRVAKGKDRLEVVDFMDTCSRIMWRQSKARLKAYRDMGAEVEIVPA